MGQDHVHLQVISRSGTRKERQNALKVLGVLQRGRHWVLVSLLLGNVITNEALPIVLDREVKGGWFAVLTSALLIVIFGEIIPQSICAKYGLSVGSWASRYVLWLMYGLFPIAFPIAKLLDLLLGRNHGMVFGRLGLKTLLMFHEGLHHSARERLTVDEISLLSSALDFNGVRVSSVMTPISKVFSLSSDAFLNDMTRYNILKSGYSNIPIHLHTQPNTETASLVSTSLEEEVAIGQISLESLPVVSSTETCLEVLNVFKERKAQVVLVIEQGTALPLGIVTARDIFEELIGE
ncbi:DUF21-domain-containing protein [Hyaloscypha bicolor E]|uniref:DUF21-domain-containing protein n=1 Tax=Hyaloscypha bicolor E TaxID=1095630 RepID=A0A2J6TUW2_9HELO|nr:DUF21-domain-containing protein [Hyaloscypha bicolor E]PMD66797.1 DUF21-domain-containing protein [Hyaloscypha bicolor E]